MPFGSLGRLERKVMAVLWDHPGVTVRQVWERLCRSRDLAYTTVMTVMNRLVAKGTLTRRRDGSVFRYSPTADRASTAARAARDSLAELVRAYGPAAVAGFVDALDRVDPRLLSELKRRSRR